MDVSIKGNDVMLCSLDDTDEEEFDPRVLETAGGARSESQISVSLVAPGKTYPEHECLVGNAMAEEGLPGQLFSGWLGG